MVRTALNFWCEHWIAISLVPLAVWILLSGLDDLFIAVVFLARRRQFPWPAKADLANAAERRIAILVPLWREHGVIGRMLEQNLAAVEYGNFDLFAGAYPNDELTIRAISEVAARDPRVHLAICPHDGPTSKGDCLNWIYRRLEEFEIRHRVKFEVLVTHDAEDLMDPESLRLINWFSRRYDMVQIPVLPLPTPAFEFTHGLYCDEFAEYQLKDIPVRQMLGGFLPSNGVGTGFRRAALERLAATRRGQIFDPTCLTEDYENGYCLHALGASQIFVPIRTGRSAPIATREYFPRHFRRAILQRTRWVTGIALQAWEHHGWCAPPRQLYWFWRDRKGLIGNLLSPLANLAFLFSLAAGQAGRWLTVRLFPPWLMHVWMATLAFSALQMALRMSLCASIYGWPFALLAPLRVVWGNAVNGMATAAALWQYWDARRRRGTLAWGKTDHDYPPHRMAQPGRPRLGELLIRMRLLSPEDLEMALGSLPGNRRLGEHLVQLRKVSEETVYEALSAQAGLPVGMPPPSDFNRFAARTLPLETVRRWRVLPYRIAIGQLHVLTSEIPSDEMTRDLARLSTLAIRYRLVRPRDFDQLAAELLGQPRRSVHGSSA